MVAESPLKLIVFTAVVLALLGTVVAVGLTSMVEFGGDLHLVALERKFETRIGGLERQLAELSDRHIVVEQSQSQYVVDDPADSGDLQRQALYGVWFTKYGKDTADAMLFSFNSGREASPIGRRRGDP